MLHKVSGVTSGCGVQELALVRAGSGAGMRRTTSQLPRQSTLDKGHIHTSNTMWRVPSMPASNAHGKRNPCDIGSTIVLWALHAAYSGLQLLSQGKGSMLTVLTWPLIERGPTAESLTAESGMGWAQE